MIHILVILSRDLLRGTGADGRRVIVFVGLAVGPSLV